MLRSSDSSENIDSGIERIYSKISSDWENAPVSLNSSSKKSQIVKRETGGNLTQFLESDSLTYGFKASPESNKDSFDKRLKHSASKGKLFKTIVKNTFSSYKNYK